MLKLPIDRCIIFRGNFVIISYFRVSRHNEQSKQHFVSNFGGPNLHVQKNFVSCYISFGCWKVSYVTSFLACKEYCDCLKRMFLPFPYLWIWKLASRENLTCFWTFVLIFLSYIIMMLINSGDLAELENCSRTRRFYVMQSLPKMMLNDSMSTFKNISAPGRFWSWIQWCNGWWFHAPHVPIQDFLEWVGMPLCKCNADVIIAWFTMGRYRWNCSLVGRYWLMFWSCKRAGCQMLFSYWTSSNQRLWGCVRRRNFYTDIYIYIP